MAGVLSRPRTEEEIREYFRKSLKRNKPGQTLKSSKQRNNQSQCESLGIWTGNPKYRLYSTVQSRTNSFKNWPNETLKIEELVEAGFAYIGVDDAVRCFYCSIGLRDWPDEASPWEQHVISSPNCGHVLQCKGKGFVRHILGEQDQDSGSDVNDSEEVIDTVQLAIKRNEKAVKVAREYCTDENILKMAIKSLIKQDLNKKFTAVELVRVIEDIDDMNENAKQIDTKNGEDSAESNDDETDDSDIVSDEDEAETNRRLKEPVTCKICFDAIACIITLPCGHMISCSQCISALTKCAVCRSQIKGTVRALMAI